MRKLLFLPPTIEKPREIEIYSISFDTINSAESLDLVRQLSIRQVWFYGEIRKGNRPSIEDLIRFWAVGEATAKRDLSDLARLGLVRFVGSRRNGHYSLDRTFEGAD